MIPIHIFLMYSNKIINIFELFIGLSIRFIYCTYSTIRSNLNLKKIIIFITNNNYVRQSDASIPVLSASSQFGLNVFEGIVYIKKIFSIFLGLEDHLKKIEQFTSLNWV